MIQPQSEPAVKEQNFLMGQDSKFRSQYPDK